MKILIIGGGNMGLTYAKSFVHSHITDRDKMMILEKSEEKQLALKQLNAGKIFSDPKDCLSKADLVIFAVKPQDAPALFESIRPWVCLLYTSPSPRD